MWKHARLFVLLSIITLSCNSNNKKNTSKSVFFDTLNAAEKNVDNTRRTAIVLATEKVSPGVVSITSISSRVVAANPFFNDPFFDMWRNFFPPSYRKEQIQSLGSGIITNPDGYIVTNAHVIENGGDINVVLPDGRKFKGKIVGVDALHDIALLKINGKNLPYAHFGNSDKLYIGEWAIAIGNPLGFLLEDVQPSVTIGVVSAVHRTIKETSGDSRIYRDMIQTDASINPGNSGGPLVDACGDVIGINTFIFTKSGGSEGLGFAIPSNTVLKIAGELKKYGKIREAYIGFTCQNLNSSLRKAFSYNGITGVLINNVFDKSLPVKEGDILIKVNGRKLYNVGDFEDITYALVPGERLNLKVVRKNKEMQIDVYAKALHINEHNLDIGAVIANITPLIKARYNLDRSHGLFVTAVKAGSFAERIGIEKGDIIYKINKKNIKNVSQFNTVWKNLHGMVTVFIDRKGQKYYVSFNK